MSTRTHASRFLTASLPQLIFTGMPLSLQDEARRAQTTRRDDMAIRDSFAQLVPE